MKPSYPYLGLFLFLCLSFYACSQDSLKKPEPLFIRQHQHVLGSATLTINETVYSTSHPLQFIQLHHNELTADEVTRTISEEMGINYLQITNGEKRLVEFKLNGRNHLFDPNRIFSTEGIVRSLKLHSDFSEEAFVGIRSLRDSLLNLLDKKKTIVAVHNNTDGEFTLADYLKNKTGQVHQNTLHDADDFFITTDSLLFTKLKAKDFNVVLEWSNRLQDDGSLSIYCSRNNIAYVNVEAEHGHKKEQEVMLRTLIEILK